MVLSYFSNNLRLKALAIQAKSAWVTLMECLQDDAVIQTHIVDATDVNNNTCPRTTSDDTRNITRTCSSLSIRASGPTVATLVERFNAYAETSNEQHFNGMESDTGDNLLIRNVALTKEYDQINICMTSMDDITDNVVDNNTVDSNIMVDSQTVPTDLLSVIAPPPVTPDNNDTNTATDLPAVHDMPEADLHGLDDGPVVQGNLDGDHTGYVPATIDSPYDGPGTDHDDDCPTIDKDYQNDISVNEDVFDNDLAQAPIFNSGNALEANSADVHDQEVKDNSSPANKHDNAITVDVFVRDYVTRIIKDVFDGEKGTLTVGESQLMPDGSEVKDSYNSPEPTQKYEVPEPTQNHDVPEPTHNYDSSELTETYNIPCQTKNDVVQGPRESYGEPQQEPWYANTNPEDHMDLPPTTCDQQHEPVALGQELSKYIQEYVLEIIDDAVCVVNNAQEARCDNDEDSCKHTIDSDSSSPNSSGSTVDGNGAFGVHNSSVTDETQVPEDKILYDDTDLSEDKVSLGHADIDMKYDSGTQEKEVTRANIESYVNTIISSSVELYQNSADVDTKAIDYSLCNEINAIRDETQDSDEPDQTCNNYDDIHTPELNNKPVVIPREVTNGKKKVHWGPNLEIEANRCYIVSDDDVSHDDVSGDDWDDNVLDGVYLTEDVDSDMSDDEVICHLKDEENDSDITGGKGHLAIGVETLNNMSEEDIFRAFHGSNRELGTDGVDVSSEAVDDDSVIDDSVVDESVVDNLETNVASDTDVIYESDEDDDDELGQYDELDED